jgi:cation transport regulator ChaB
MPFGPQCPKEVAMPGRSSMPKTIQRSPKKAQETYEKVLENAEEQYGDGERAHRTALAALKHTFEKVDDHWEPKKHKGPSDPRAALPRGSKAKRDERGETFGGVDYYGHTKVELYERAKSLGVRGRSRMDKRELARAIASKQG